MRIRLTLHPHQDGAKGLRTEYGDRLVWVRSRYDEQHKNRDKTGELIVEGQPWDPARTVGGSEHLVQLRVAVKELTVRQQSKSAGGRWDPDRQVWELRHDLVRALGLTERIVAAGT